MLAADLGKTRCAPCVKKEKTQGVLAYFCPKQSAHILWPKGMNKERLSPLSGWRERINWLAEGNELPPIPAQRLDHELCPNRQQGGIGPIERHMRQLGGVKALVAGAFAEHSADVHILVDGLAEAAIPRTSKPPLPGGSVKAKGAAKALLYADYQSAPLQLRLSSAGAPAIESPAGAGPAVTSNDARAETYIAPLPKTTGGVSELHRLLRHCPR
jgi:hypothetical protein